MVCFESSDRYPEALELTDRALELARRVGDRVWEGIFLGGPISSLVLLGRWDEALARSAAFGEVGGHGIDASLDSHLVHIRCERGETPLAREWLEDAARHASEEDIQVEIAHLVAEAQILRSEGRPREALGRAETVVEVRSKLGITYLHVKLGLVEALEAAFLLDDKPKLEELLLIVETLRPGERPPLLQAHAHRFRAKSTGDEAHFKTATSLFRELSLDFWLAVTLLEHGELLMEQGRPGAAEPLLADARAIFERLEAAPWLERVDVVAPPQAEVPA